MSEISVSSTEKRSASQWLRGRNRGKAYSDEVIQISGWLYKMGGARGGMKNWKKRWFVLKQGCLYYYKEELTPESIGNVVMGVMPIYNTIIYDHGSSCQAPPDKDIAAICSSCHREFSLTVRRHHCRSCGQSFCDKCSILRVPLPKLGLHSPVRVCDPCGGAVTKENKLFLANSAATARRSVGWLLMDRVVELAKRDENKEKKQEKVDTTSVKFNLPAISKPNMFALKTAERELWLHAEDKLARIKWVSTLFKVKERYKKEKEDKAKGVLPEGDPLWEIDYAQIILKQKVATGAFGDIFRGRLWGTDAAIKTLKISASSDDSLLADLKQEVKILSQLRHPNVVLYIGACTKGSNICIVTEWCARGSLYDVLHDPATFISCKMMVDMALGIAQGMNYLHRQEKPIIHRDLKSYNVLVTKDFGVKVADFGLSFGFKQKTKERDKDRERQDKSRDIQRNNSYNLYHSNNHKTQCRSDVVDKTSSSPNNNPNANEESCSDMPNDIFGTPEWMAPEVMEGLRYDEKVDVYSYGVLLTEILTRQKPFVDQFPITDYQDVFDQVLDNGAVPSVPKWSELFVQELVLACVSRDPSLRPSFTDIILYLQEFLHLDENQFFQSFEFVRMTSLLGSDKTYFQALGAAELAVWAYREKTAIEHSPNPNIPHFHGSLNDSSNSNIRYELGLVHQNTNTDQRDLPDPHEHLAVPAAMLANACLDPLTLTEPPLAYSFALLPPAAVKELVASLAALASLPAYSKVQLSACRALVTLGELFGLYAQKGVWLQPPDQSSLANSIKQPLAHRPGASAGPFQPLSISKTSSPCPGSSQLSADSSSCNSYPNRSLIYLSFVFTEGCAAPNKPNNSPSYPNSRSTS
jgi:serine/threonine protein kinase